MDPDHIRELFAAFGSVDVRRMFGGAGVFVDGMMIALVSRDVVYLKADTETIPAFEREGLAPFSYMAKGSKRTITSYWRMPDRLYDDADELATWARASVEVARRKAARTSGAARKPMTGQSRKPKKVRRPASRRPGSRPSRSRR
jgi:DNA transformation protein and related proteins